jgi:exportin-2 (importin alpha re-exporter)
MFGISIHRESSQGVSETNPAVSVMDFFTTHIFPELQDVNHNNRPMVKATALKFVCTFRNQFTREQLVALVPLLIKHLSSPIVVVHTFAAYAIERILFTKETEANGAKRHKISGVELQPFLEPLFTGLFNIVDNTDWNENEHVMKCVMRSLATAGADVIPITGIVFSKLATALERVCKNPRNPMFNHYLFESIAVLVRNVCSRDPSQTGQLEALLFPPFQTILQLEIVEFTPYVFQVLAQLLEYRPAGAGLGDAYTMLFPPLLTPGLWERKGNVPALVRLVQAYLKKAARELAEQGHLVGILGVFQKLISSKATESSAFELLSAIMMYGSHEAVKSYLNTIFQILFMRLQHGKTVRYVRLITNFFALLAGKYGSQVFFDSTNQIQPGVALNLLVQVWVPRLQTDPPLRMDAKIQVVGLTRLLCDTPPALLSDDNGKKIWAQVLAAVVTMVTSPSWSNSAGDDEDQEVEIGYDATYSGLTFARKALDDPFADIADPIAVFVKSLHTLSTSQPGVITPIIQQGLGSDPKLSSGLQSMFQKSGLQLA